MAQHIKEIEDIINKTFKDFDVINILDAGCGSVNNIKFVNNVHITGIDISKYQLERSKHLDEKILGDLEKYKFTECDFDLIVCWDVLEHLKNPTLALDNLKEAVKKDGLILLKLPNLFSLKGLITKYTPYFFHHFVYKYIFKSGLVNRKDGGPFKTYLRFNISQHSLIKYAQKHELSIIYNRTYDFGDIWNPLGKGIKNKIYIYLRDILKILSFYRVGDSELIILLKK